MTDAPYRLRVFALSAGLVIGFYAIGLLVSGGWNVLPGLLLLAAALWLFRFFHRQTLRGMRGFPDMPERQEYKGELPGQREDPR